MKAFSLSLRTLRPALLPGLLLIGLLLAACDGASSSPDEYLARAQTALQEGELRTAEIELKNALRTSPENTLARALLGQALAGQGNAVAAAQELERARDLGAELELVQPWLAQAWLQTGEYDKVKQLVITDAATEPLKARLLALQARASLAAGDLDAAATKATQALETDDAAPEVTLAMAHVQFAQEDIAQARAFAERALAAAPSNADANMLLGEIERQQGNLEAAEAAFSAAMEDPLTAPRARLNRTYTRIQREDMAGAREDIAKLREALKGNALVDYAEGLLLYTEGKYSEASALLDAALGSNPNLLPALRLAGATQLALKEPKLARIHLERFLSAQPDDLGAKRMFAMALLQTGKPDEAETLARELVEQDSEDFAAMDLLASALMLQGKREEGTNYLRRVQAVAPSSPELDTRLGLALLDQGDQEEGLRLLRETAEQNPESADAVEKLVAGLARSGDLDESLKTAQDYQRQHPDSAHAQTLVAAVYLQQGDNAKAKAAFEQALATEPGNLPASKALAALATQAEDYDQASDILKASLTQHPQDLTLLIALAKLALAQDDAETAKTYLDQALENHPSKITPKLYMSAYFLRQGNAREALSFAADAVAIEPENPAALGLRSDAQLALKDFRAARTSLQDLNKLLAQPNPRVLWALARAELALGNLAEAKSALEEARAAAPEFAPALLALSRIAIQQQNPAEAADHLAALKAQLGENQRDVLLLEGDLARLQGNLAVADDAFRSLLDADADLDLDQDTQLWSAAEQLVLAYVREGDSEAGLKSALQLAELQPNSARTHALLGVLYLRDQQPEQATAAFEQALALDPANATATNGLVSLAVQNEDFDKASALFETALQKDPYNLSLLIGSARLALLQDDPQTAENFLLKGVESNPESPAAKFYLGAFYLGQGKAEQTLELVTTPDGNLEQNPRLLALKAESEINLQQFDTALRTLQALNRQQPNQPRVLLTIANTQARLGRLRLAQETLTQVLELQPESVPALRGLVRLALAGNSAETAQQHIDALKAILGADHNDVLRFEGQMAEQAGDFDLALSRYRAILEQSPSSGSLLLVARILARQEQTEAARQLLNNWLEKNPQDNLVRFELAQLELNGGGSDRAIAEYQTLVDSGVENPVVLNNLAWLLKDGAPEKALSYAREAHELAPKSPDIADTLAVLLLEHNEPEEARSLIDLALGEKPNNASMLYHKALILSELGEAAQARALVEKALETPSEFPEREKAEVWLKETAR